MVADAARRKLDKLPASPGVYVFHGADGKVLYVGKARSLRSRVRSYFQPGSSDRARLEYCSPVRSSRQKHRSHRAVPIHTRSFGCCVPNYCSLYGQVLRLLYCATYHSGMARVLSRRGSTTQASLCTVRVSRQGPMTYKSQKQQCLQSALPCPNAFRGGPPSTLDRAADRTPQT